VGVWTLSDPKFISGVKCYQDEDNVTLVAKKLYLGTSGGKIPTAFVPLAPDKLVVKNDIDVLVGVFHIMWEDMPRRRTYQIRLQDLISESGEYFGTRLRCGSDQRELIQQLG
jgi:hypothetical protein